jgi:hypothetical protein
VARPRNNPVAPELTPGQAKWVIQRMISERRLSPGEVQRYVGDMQREITDLERQLDMLRQAHGGSGSSSASSSSAAGSTGARRGRKPGRKPGRPSNASLAAAAQTSGGGEQPARKRRGRPPRSASANASPAGQQSGGEQSGAKAGRGGKRRQRASITPEQLASRQLQGRYLALIRQIPANRRAQYTKMVKEKGRETAIRELQDALKK